jgi:hypothetical protein
MQHCSNGVYFPRKRLHFIRRVRRIQSVLLQVIKMRGCHVFSEYPNDVSVYVRAGVEEIGCNLLDSVAVRQELGLPVRRLTASFASKSAHGGFADPTFDRFTPVHHKKRERQSFAVMADNFVTCQWHRNYQQDVAAGDFSRCGHRGPIYSAPASVIRE